MADTYKLQYDGMTLTYPGWNGCVSYEAQSFKTLTLLNSEGGTLTANTLTGYPGDTINLSTAYNTYWRFSGYKITGDGSLVGNDYTFGSEDATICACYKPNAFTASGGFEKGSDVVYQNMNTDTRVKYYNLEKYATVSYKTSNVPTAWYATSNRWKPNDSSAYSLTSYGKLGFDLSSYSNMNKQGAGVTACQKYGSTYNNVGYMTAYNATRNKWASVRRYYSTTFNTTTQNQYLTLSSRICSTNYSLSYLWDSVYRAECTSGTWTATGYAP